MSLLEMNTIGNNRFTVNESIFVCHLNIMWTIYGNSVCITCTSAERKITLFDPSATFYFIVIQKKMLGIFQKHKNTGNDNKTRAEK